MQYLHSFKNLILRHTKSILFSCGVIIIVVGVIIFANLIFTKHPKSEETAHVIASIGKFAFNDGTFRVGKDIQAGTYRTKNTESSRAESTCHWIRSKGLDPNANADVIGRSFHNVSGVGSQTVTILLTDVTFSSIGCGSWFTGLTRVTPSNASFGPGALVVGSDVSQGVYGSTGPISTARPCYWVRLKDFTDTATGLTDKIDKSMETAPFAVQIRASDKGFLSLGCKDFHRFSPVKIPNSQLVPSVGTLAFADGNYTVGKDIQPGVYRTKGGNTGPITCAWSRNKDSTNNIESTLGYHIGNGILTVEILATDISFHVRGCGNWYSGLKQLTPNRVSFGDGTFVVNSDIEAGLYANSGPTKGNTCYAWRLTNFTSDNQGKDRPATGTSYAQYQVADLGSNGVVGFYSSGCGIWTKYNQ
jgi:hypothetical protein